MNVHQKTPADGALAYAKGYGLMQNPFSPGTVANDRWARDWRWQAEIHPGVPAAQAGHRKAG